MCVYVGRHQEFLGVEGSTCRSTRCSLGAQEFDYYAPLFTCKRLDLDSETWVETEFLIISYVILDNLGLSFFLCESERMEMIFGGEL